MSNTKSASLRSLSLLVFVLFSLVAAVRGQKEGTDLKNDQQSLLKPEDRWLANEHDPAGLQSILADDFVHAVSIGFITKQNQINYWRTTSAPPRAKHFEDRRVRVYGDVGIVNGIVVATAPDGTVEKTVFTDVFAHRNGQWQAVNAQENQFQARPNRQAPTSPLAPSH